MADAPKFARFVRSVQGCVVQRYGTTELIGATRRPLTHEQKERGESPYVWDYSIVPLTDRFCREFVRELNEHVRAGELVEVQRSDWEKQQADQQDAELAPVRRRRARAEASTNSQE
jgi:hypothetical protein